jgi:uncharacterized protein (DUF4415 family)
MKAKKSGTTRFRLKAAEAGHLGNGLSPAGLSAEQAARLDAAEIDYSDVPELDDTFWSSANTGLPDSKTQVTLRLDTDVLDFFRGTGKRYQTRINAVLRAYAQSQKFPPAAAFAGPGETPLEVHEPQSRWGVLAGDVQAAAEGNTEPGIPAEVAIEDYLSQMKAIRESITPLEFMKFLEAQRKLQLVVDAKLQALLDDEQHALAGASKMRRSIGSQAAIAVIQAAIAAAGTTYETAHQAAQQALDLAEHGRATARAVASRTLKAGRPVTANKP